MADTIAKRKKHPGKLPRLRKPRAPPITQGLCGRSLATFIYKVLRKVSKTVGISNKAMSIMNTMAIDLIKRILDEAMALCQKVHPKSLLFY